MAFSLSNLIMGAIEMIVGAFMLATGIGGGLGAKLLLAGGLTVLSSFLSARTGLGGWKSSPTYGFDQLGNAQYEGSPVNVPYGEHKMKPGIISVNLKSEGGKQVAYILCLIGVGPIESISQVRLNDVVIESFKDAVATTDRLGAADQKVIDGFNETGTQYQAGTRLSNGEAHIHEMKAAADSLIVNVVFQGGLWAISKGGNPSNASATLKVEYRPYGSTGGWTAYSPEAADKPTWDMDAKQAGTWKTWGETRDPLRLQIPIRLDGKSGHPARGRYQIRVTGNGPVKTNATNVADLVSVIEVNNDGRTYAGFALLGLKLPASSQLDGIPSISCVVKGRKVYDPRDGVTRWTDNPVLCARDLLTNTQYGLGVPESKIDATSWNAMATACDATVTPPWGGSAEARWRLDYVVDVQSAGVDHLTQMLASCRMTLVNADRKVYIVQDAAKASSRAFDGRSTRTVADRIANGGGIRDTGSPARSTLVASSLDALQRWTKVRVTYVDRNRDWQQRGVEVFDQYVDIGAIAGGTFGAGHKIKGSTSKALGRLVATFANGARSLAFVQDDAATPFQSGETVTDLTSGATATTSSAPYTITPERVFDVQMFGVTRRTQAMREARYHLNVARSRTTFATWGGFLGDLDLLPGDVVTLAADHLAWTGKAFSVLTMGFDAEGLSTFQAREYTTDAYEDNVDTTQIDALRWVPGGAIPPGLRVPSGSQPTTSQSSGNTTDGGQQYTPAPTGSVPSGAASSVSVSSQKVGA